MCSLTFAKVLMVLFNLLILLAGAGLVALGIWMEKNAHTIMNIVEVFSVSSVFAIQVDYFFIAVGFVMVLLGILGLCGAKKESKCLLITFFSIVFMIFISELTIGVFVMAFSSLLENILRARGKPVLQTQYGLDAYTTQLWNMTMTKLQCCGFNDYTDFKGSYYCNSNSGHYPASCCGDVLYNVSCDLQTAQNSTVQGCYGLLTMTLRTKTYFIGSIAAGVGGLEMAAMFLALYLFCILDQDST